MCLQAVAVVERRQDLFRFSGTSSDFNFFTIDFQRHLFKMIPGAGAETAVTVIEFEQSAMGAADDQASVFAGEFIRRPVQGTPV